MATKNLIASLYRENVQIANRASAVHTVAASPITIYNITGGPVELLTLGAVVTGAPGGAGTFNVTVSGVAACAGAVAVNGAVGTVIYIPLNVAGAILNAAAIPKTVATLTTMLAGPGAIVVTVGVASITCEWFCVYRKLTPTANINPA